ncbi:MAG: hypothetical protein WA144_06245 [Candidatus Methanoperedens sp.]
MKESENRTQYFYPTPVSIQHDKNNDKESYDLMVTDFEGQTKIFGEYCFIIGESQLNIVSPDKSLNFHHNRNRENKDEREKLIYNYESIDEGQEFSGKILGSQKDLENFINIFSNSIRINIGKSKNIQYGKATIEFLSKKPEEFFSDIYFVNQEIEHEFIITLLSPAIIYNDNGFSTTSISDLRKLIAESVGTPIENINISKSFIKSDTIENFVSIWRLKKPTETAFAAGSCFKITINSWNENIKKQLFELQKKGIGERRKEGFGRFVLNWQKLDEDKYNVSEFKDMEIAEPKESPPKIVNNIIKNIIVNEYQKQTEHEALKDCYEFSRDIKRLPSNSVVGRLELIIRNLVKPETFSSLIEENLRKTAKDKLRNCRNEKSNLFMYITEKNPNIEQKIINQKPKLKEISALINYDPLELKNELYKLYWITFFRLIRKEKWITWMDYRSKEK